MGLRVRAIRSSTPPLVQPLESRLLMAADAVEVINVGDHLLLPDTPNQKFQIFVSGPLQLEGVDIIAQVADGGPEAGGHVRGPSISLIDPLNGTVFAGNNVGPEGKGTVFPQVYGEIFTVTNSGTVPGTGLFCTVTVDTTGILDGTYDFKLVDTKYGDSDLAFTPVHITNGHLIVGAPGTVPSGNSSVSGTVFNDAAGNGARGRKGGLQGRTVYIDGNDNGQLDSGEPTALTDSAGNYTLANIAPGTYAVREDLPAGWRQTLAPAPRTEQHVTLKAGKRLKNQNFADTSLAQISGTVFLDRNGNGQQDAAEPGLAGCKIVVEINNNGTWQPTRFSTVSRARGSFTVNVPAGSYRLRQLPKGRLHVTNPADGFYLVTLEAAAVIGGQTFADA